MVLSIGPGPGSTWQHHDGCHWPLDCLLSVYKDLSTPHLHLGFLVPMAVMPTAVVKVNNFVFPSAALELLGRPPFHAVPSLIDTGILSRMGSEWWFFTVLDTDQCLYPHTDYTASPASNVSTLTKTTDSLSPAQHMGSYSKCSLPSERVLHCSH